MMARMIFAFILVFALSPAKVLSDELCDLYKTPGDCLRQPESVLEGLNFIPNPIRSASAPSDLISMYENASRNSLGLMVTVYIEHGHIISVRYSRNTGRYTIGPKEYQEFRDSVVRAYDKAEWTDGPGRNTRIYDDGETRVHMSSAHVAFRDVGCGTPGGCTERSFGSCSRST